MNWKRTRRLSRKTNISHSPFLSWLRTLDHTLSSPKLRKIKALYSRSLKRKLTTLWLKGLSSLMRRRLGWKLARSGLKHCSMRLEKCSPDLIKDWPLLNESSSLLGESDGPVFGFMPDTWSGRCLGIYARRYRR